MKAFLLGIILLLLLSTVCFASVSTYEINYDISIDSVHENIRLTFSESMDATMKFVFVNRVNIITVSGDKGPLRHELQSGQNTTLVIYPNSSREIFISLEQFNSVLSSPDFYQFIDDFTSNEDIGRLVVSATLPRGFVVYRDFYMPSSAEIITDGERITLLWIETNTKSISKIYSVKFAGTNDYGFVIAPIAIIVVLVAAFILFFRYHKKKLLHEFKKGFSEDEIKVVDIIKKERTVYQNKIEKELKFSRTKMTRITEKFRQKGLIEKKRYGRTNKLRWTG